MNFNKRNIIIFFGVIVSILFYLLFVMSVNFSEINDGYKITAFLPIMFFLCFILFLYRPLIEKKSPFITLFVGVAFVRYVILSIVTLINKDYVGISGINPSSDSLNLAAFLMMWELLVLSIAINYWSMKYIPSSTKSKELRSDANIAIYIVFILISIFLILIVPSAREGLSFFGSINGSMREDIGSVLILGIREMFINAKYFLLFIMIIILSKNTNRPRFMSYLVLITVSIIVMSLRIGSNRKKMLADSLPIILILWKKFPSYKKITTLLITSVGAILVALTTVYREMTESTTSFFNEYFGIEFLQPYFLGQYNVALAIEAKKQFSENLDVNSYIINFFRPIFGIGSFVKNIDYVSAANIFDSRVSLGLRGFRGDQILPSIGEGYILFGFLLAPLIGLCVVGLGIYVDRVYIKGVKLETNFLASLIAFYLAQIMILNSTIILNVLSFRLAIFYTIVYLAYNSYQKQIVKLEVRNYGQIK